MLAISCTQRKTITSIPDAPNIPNIPDGDVGGFASATLVNVDTTNKTPSAQVTFFLNNGQPNDTFEVSTSLKNVQLNNGWKWVSSDPVSASCTGSKSSFCTITFTLDATNINLGSPDGGSVVNVNIPFSYTVNGKAPKASTVSVPYQTDHLKWKVNVGFVEPPQPEGNISANTSPIALSDDGKIYVAGQTTDHTKGVLYYINPADGSTVKSYQTSIPFIYNPIVGTGKYSNYTYFTASDHKVHYVNISTGEIKNSCIINDKSKVCKDIGYPDSELSPRMRLLYTETSGIYFPSYVPKGTDDNLNRLYIHRVNNTTLQDDSFGEDWGRAPTDKPSSCQSDFSCLTSSPIFSESDGVVYFGTAGNPVSVFGFDMNNNTVSRFSGGYSFYSEVASNDAYIFAGNSGGQIMRIIKGTTPKSEIVFSVPSSKCDIGNGGCMIQTKLTATNSNLYFATNGTTTYKNDNTLYMLSTTPDKTSNQLLLQWCLGRTAIDAFMSDPIFDDGAKTLYASSNDTMNSFNPDSSLSDAQTCNTDDTHKKINWSYKAAGPITANPVLSSDKKVIYFVADDGYLYSLRTQSSAQ